MRLQAERRQATEQKQKAAQEAKARDTDTKEQVTQSQDDNSDASIPCLLCLARG